MNRSHTNRSSWCHFIQAVLLSGFLAGCSIVPHLRNAVELPIKVYDLQSLDSLELNPNALRFRANAWTGFLRIDRDLRLEADPESRAVWTGTTKGCLEVTAGSRVRISDMNFQGGSGSEPLLRVNAGAELTLQSCELNWASGWGIEVQGGGRLILEEVIIRNMGEGGIFADSALIRIHASIFDHAGGLLLRVERSPELEISNTEIVGGHAFGIQVINTERVWFDSVLVQGSLEHGMLLDGVDEAILSHSTFSDHGRTALICRNGGQLGILGSSFVLNQQSGLQVHHLDSLRMVDTEIGANKATGIRASGIRYFGSAGLNISHNEGYGMLLTGLDSVIQHHSLLSANDSGGLKILEVDRLQLLFTRFSGNGLEHALTAGLWSSDVDTLELSEVQFVGNRARGLSLAGASRIRIADSEFQDHGETALLCDSTLQLDLLRNHFSENQQGVVLRRVARVNSQANTYRENGTALLAFAVDTLFSRVDTLAQNHQIGYDLRQRTAARIRDLWSNANGTGIAATAADVLLDGIRSRGNRSQAVHLINGQLLCRSAFFQEEKIALRIAKGCVLRATASTFQDGEKGAVVENAGNLILRACTFEGGQTGIEMQNFSRLDVQDCRFSALSGPVLETSGANILGSRFTLNDCRNNRLLFWLQHLQGELAVSNNTWLQNAALVEGERLTPMVISHTILSGFASPLRLRNFSKIDMTASLIWDVAQMDSNSVADVGSGNIFADPLLDTDGYPLPDSPCLTAAPDGALIGAYTVAEKRKDWLAP